MKGIHAHLNLQPPHSSIASKGEGSIEIESFEERVSRFDVETLVQQWYGDASFSSFSFDYGGMAGASSSHLLHLIPLLKLTLMMMKEKKAVNKMKMMSKAF
jgi:hypothetical protein